MADQQTWSEGLPVAITVTDANGTILEMNARSRETFAADGGAALIGQNLFACHPEPARTKTQAMYQTRKPNHYTISRAGQRKMIHQMPWFKNGVFAGFVEISIPIPDQLEHFDRG
ncbi:MAG TPA: PAS domain-containing protein [Vicinamibacterales bacterium]